MCTTKIFVKSVSTQIMSKCPNYVSQPIKWEILSVLLIAFPSGVIPCVITLHTTLSVLLSTYRHSVQEIQDDRQHVWNCNTLRQSGYLRKLLTLTYTEQTSTLQLLRKGSNCGNASPSLASILGPFSQSQLFAFT